jgi:N-acetylneuraminic acid mutarotase
MKPKALLLLIAQLTALLLVGGLTLTTGQTAQAATLSDFTQIEWTDLGTAAQFPMGAGVSEAQSSTLNNKLYVFGGYAPCCTPTRRAYVFDPATTTWTRLADLPKGLTHGGFTNDGVDIYYAGGYVENATQTGQVFGSKEVWRYNVAANTYTRLPDLPVRASTGQMTYVNGKLHYLGGTTPDNRSEDLPDHYVFDLEAWKTNPDVKWVDITDTSPLPNPRQHASIAVVDGMIYYLGGQKGHDGDLEPQNDVHRYNPQTDEWTQMADMPDLGRNHAGNSTVVMGGRIIVMAGQKWSGIFKSTVYAFDPVANTWTELTPLPMEQHSGVGAAINGVLYFGMGGSNNGANDRRAVRKGVPILEDVTPTATGVTPTDTPQPETSTPDAPTSTPEATATSDSTGEATHTPQPPTNTPGGPTETPNASTSTPDSTSTATATTDPAVTPTATDMLPTGTPDGSIELLVNGSFEVDNGGDKVPDGWKGKQLSSDKIKCNKDKDGDGIPDKIVAQDGNCAFQFKGGVGENARLAQTVSGGSFGAGDTLTLSGYVNTKAGSGRLQVKVKYGDSTSKTKLSAEFVVTDGYQLLTDTDALASGNVAKIKAQIKHTSTAGKVRVDGMSLRQYPASAVLPLP